MPVNYANAFAPKVAEAFHLNSLTDSARGTDYSFSGLRTVKVMSVDTVPLNAYQRTGMSRYGAPVELGDSVQELTMRDDQAFAMTIDKGNQSDQLNLKGAARAMRREIEQVVIPYVDKYRFREWSFHAGIVNPLSAAPAKNSIVTAVFDAACEMDNQLVPANNRTLFIRNSLYKLLALSDEFLGVDKLGEHALSKGVVGEIDGMTVKRVPDSYLPEKVYFLVKYKGSTADPVKLNETKIHQDPPGLSGHLLEGRFYHDAFVLGAKACGLYAAVASGAQTAAPTATAASGGASFSASGATIYYTTDGSDPRYSASALVYASALSGLEPGTVVRAYAVKDGSFPSAVVQTAAT